MNKSDAHLYLPFVQALSEGKTIERQSIGFDEWQNLGDYDFSLLPEHYRIKPEPIERYMTISPGGMVRCTFIQPPEDMLAGDRLVLMREVTDEN